MPYDTGIEELVSAAQDPVLTPDNPLLSGPTNGPEQAAAETLSKPSISESATDQFAINCANDLADQVQNYVQAGTAAATRRAYRSDLDHFLAWGGTIPAADSQLAAYLAAHAHTLKVATLVRRLATISIAHEAQSLPNPVRSPLIRATMRGIRRERGVAQRQAKPLLREDLFAVLAAIGNGLKDARDAALLLIGFAGGFRRSELVALDVADLERVQQGFVITIRRSKTDQDGAGRKIGIPFGRTKWCPVAAVDHWFDRAGIAGGPIFRRVDRHGRVLQDRLSPEAVCIVVRERAAAAGYDPMPFSGHSLRAGLATSAVQAGASALRIRQQTGHASDAMLSRYIRNGELFIHNVARTLL